MNVYSSYQIAALLTFLSTGLLALFVLVKGGGRVVTRIFGIYTLAISGWSFCWYRFVLCDTYAGCLFWCRFLHYPASFIPATFLHFVQHLLGINKERKQILLRRSFYGLGIFFSSVAFAPGFIKTVAPTPGFVYYLVAGPYYVTFFAYFVVAVTTIHTLLFLGYKGANGFKKTQIGYVFAAYVLAYTGGIATFLPVINLTLPSFALYLIPLCQIIVAYTILAHHLMDIGVVIRKTVIYSLVSAGLVSAYVGSITLFSRLLEVRSSSAPPLTALKETVGAGFQWMKAVAQTSFSSSCIAIALLSIGLGVFVWYQGRHKPANRLWCFMCFSVAMWSFGLGMMVRSHTSAEALFWQTCFLYGGACLIPTVFLHFVSFVANQSLRKTLIAAYAASGAEFLLNVSGHLATVGPRPPFNFYTVSYPIYFSYFVFFMVVATYAHIILAKTFFSAEGQLKEQIRYICVGTFIGFCGGATTFLYVFGIDIFPYGTYAVPVYIVTVSYAIFKHRLMDINVVIRRTLLYSAVSAVLACVYVSTIMLLAYVFGVHKSSISPLSSAMAAVIITLLFNPVRVRIQRFVDRHFMREALDQALLREATSGFVHEIKRPLANISLPAELSLMDLRDLKSKRRALKDVLPKLEERLQYILNQTADAGNKIEAIREFSNSNGKPPEDLELAQIVRKSVSAEELLLRRHQIELKLDITDDLPLIKGHPKQLEIVISNLIKNAAEAMAQMDHGSERKIWLSASVAADKITIQVKDSGPGIKPEARLRLFEPYFTTKGAHGTGMGLYLCRQIVQAHGGTISVDSLNDRGTTFTLTLSHSNGSKI